MHNQKLFNKYNKGTHWIGHPTEYAEHFSQFLKNKDFNGLLIDVGCGSGRDVSVFKQNGFNTKGIDNSEESIQSARSTYKGCNFNIGNAEQLIFENESIDAFFMINVIHYIDPQKAVKEIKRTLKKNGYFFIHFNLKIIDKNGNTDYEQKRSKIDQLLKDFQVIEERVFERIDQKPVEHTHTILELILQKP